MKLSATRSLTTFCLAMLCTALCLLLAGCANQNMQIGSSSDPSSFEATNETGQTISAVALKATSAQDFGDNLDQNKDWDTGTPADIHYDPQAYTSEDGADDQAATATMCLETAAGMTYELHELDLGSIKDATIFFDDGFAYLEYTNASTGEAQSTFEAEKAAHDQQLAAEEAEKAAEKAAAEQAAREQEARQAQQSASSSTNTSSGSQAASTSSSGSSSGSSSASKGSSNSASSGSSSSAGSSSSSSSSSDAEDTCVDDLVLNK